MAAERRRLGVEEEFLLVERSSGRPLPKIEAVIPDAVELAGDQAQRELHQAQIEAVTAPTEDLGRLGDELHELRAKMAAAAAGHGATVVCSGTYPGEMGRSGRLITEDDRYLTMADRAGVLAQEHLICGCHIHVSIEDHETAIAVMNGVQRWTGALLALAANSPFWEGHDTGFASYRTEVWARWPTAGPTGRFSSYEEYSRLLDHLVGARVILDRAMAYWDVRPSERYPTLEFRVTDVMLDVEDTLAVAGLVRALVEHGAAQTTPPPPLRPELLRAASWQAARSGLRGELLDPGDGSTVAAPDMVERLLETVSASLERLGDARRVLALVEDLLRRGNGAERQRAAYARAGRMADVLSLGAL